MSIHRPLSRALVACLTALLAAPALAGGPDAPTIAQNCLEAVATRSAQRVQANHHAASACVAQIEELLENGQTNAAQVAAAACKHRIAARTSRVIHRNHHQCAHCTYILLGLDAPGLASFVQEACSEASQTVKMSRNAAIAAINAALDGGDG